MDDAPRDDRTEQGRYPRPRMSVTPLQAGPGLDPLLFGAGIVLLIITIYSSVERVSEHEKVVVTVFGEFREILDPGLHLVPPFISRSHSFDTRTRTIDIPAQEGITRDNTPVTAEGVAYAKVMDPKKMLY